MPEQVKVLILGSGPAGETAALYTARAELEPVVLTGLQAGGQLTITTEVENFPGFPEGVQGPELMEKLNRQSARFGAVHKVAEAKKVDLSSRPFSVWTSENEEPDYRAQALIVATGASARWLDLPSVERLRNKGISACATCDGFFFKDKDICVVGGGDSAMEEALFLSRFGKRVRIIHRRDQLRASKAMQKKVFENPKIEILWNTVVEEALGEDRLTGLRLRNVKTGEVWETETDGLFMALGHVPNTAFLEGQIELDEKGYIRTVPGTARTSVEGVFACGDVQDPVYRQAVTAAGSGCMAAIEAERFLG